MNRTRKSSPIRKLSIKRKSSIKRTPSPIRRKSSIKRKLSIKRTPSPIRKQKKDIGTIYQINYLVDDKGIMSSDDIEYNEELSFDVINREINEHATNKTKTAWKTLEKKLKENDVVWQRVKRTEQCDRAVFLVIKKNGKKCLKLFPSYGSAIWKNNISDDWTEGDCIVNGSMIHPVTKGLVKVKF